MLLYKYLTFLSVNCVNNIFKKKLKVSVIFSYSVVFD